MSKRVEFFLISAAIVAVLVLAWDFSATGPVQPLNVVKIGAVLPLTGNQAVYGQGIQEGLELAVKEINASSSYPLKLQILYQDDASEATNAVSAAQELINVDHVVAIIAGPSQYSLAIAPIAEGDKVVLYTMASQAKALDTAGDYIFKNDDDLSRVGAALAQEMFNLGYRRSAWIYASYNEAVVDAYNGFVDKFDTLGGSVEGEKFTNNEKDFRGYLVKLMSDVPDSLVVSGMPIDNPVILKQISNLGIKTKLFGLTTIEDPQVIQNAGAITNGLIFATFNPVLPEEFVNKTQQSYGHHPLRWSAEAYDGLRVIAYALGTIKTGDITSDALRNALSALKEYEGVAGKVEFDAQGNAHRQVFMKIIQNGKIELYPGTTTNVQS